MIDSFSAYQLSDICTRLSSGKSIHSSKVSEAGPYPVIGGNGYRGFTQEPNFVGECAVIGRQGAACGNVRFFSGKAYMTEHAVVAQTNPSHNTRYLAYLLSTMELGRLSAQSAQPGLSVKTLGKQEVSLPSKETQDRIVALLGALDDAIESNAKLNDYLAQLCEAIAEKYCEAGEVRLGDICHQVTDKANCEDAKLETYVSTESLLQNKQGRQQASSLPTTGKVTLYAAGDTLVSNIRPYFKKVWYAPFDGTCSGDVLVFRANEAEDAPYLHACLRQDRFFDHVMRGAKGTKMPRGDKKQMMEFCVSSTCGADDLSLMKAALNQIAANDAESANLEDLRDTLLPKLMSGEIDVSKVDLTQLNNHLVEH